LGVTGAGSATIFVQNGNQNAQLTFNVQKYPECESGNPLLRKPKDNENNLPKIVESNKEKMEAISDNTEGVKSVELKSNNPSTTQKSLYPNPAKDVLNVDNIQGVQTLLVIDLNGKVLRSIPVEKDEIGRTINVSNLSNGMYILKKIRPDGQLEATKFQVIH
jgi:hypothetical protein